MTPLSPRRRHGALKAEVLRAVLRAPAPLTARQVVEALAAEDAPALTTILTVLDRLYRSGEVTKERGENGDLLFGPARHDAAVVADDMLDSLLRSKDRTGALLSFAGALDPEDLQALRALVAPDQQP